MAALQHARSNAYSRPPVGAYHIACCGCIGAAIAGGAHYVTTAKRLVEDGIDPTQRVKAMPVAVSILQSFAGNLLYALQALLLAAASSFGCIHNNMHSCGSSWLVCVSTEWHWHQTSRGGGQLA
jgi:hypothetical protein